MADNTERCVECGQHESADAGEYFTVQSPKCTKDPRDPAADFGELFACAECKHGLAAELGIELDEYDRANSSVTVVKHGRNSAGPGGAIVDVALYMRPADAPDAERFGTERRVWRIVYQPSGRRLVREYRHDSGVAANVVECRPARPRVPSSHRRAFEIAKRAGLAGAEFIVVGIPTDGCGAAPRHARYDYTETAEGTLASWRADGDAAYLFTRQSFTNQ